MKLIGTNGQANHYLYDASGTVASSTVPQLILPQSLSRSMILFANTSSNPLYLEFGSARATCAITSGAVSSVTVTNAGFNFTKPPVVRFWGGGNQLGGGNQQMASGNAINTSYLGLNLPGGSSPSHPARGRAVLSGGSVSSIVIDDPGVGYVIAPFVFLFNSDLDPYGCAAPNQSTGIGILVPSGSTPLQINGSAVTTDPIAVAGIATSTYSMKWMD